MPALTVARAVLRVFIVDVITAFIVIHRKNTKSKNERLLIKFTRLAGYYNWMKNQMSLLNALGWCRTLLITI